MAPGYRNTNRRQNRTGYVDHDVFEGLPVRQWRRDYVMVAPHPTQENTSSPNDIWAVELPHGMPKDSHLLPQHSQDLLRAARSGRIYKRAPPVEEEEVDPEAILGEKPEKKDDDPRDKGFTVKTWKQIPRHMEVPDVEYLAKRRKGLITISSKAAASGPTMIKTTVRREDAAGNEYVKEIIAPKGSQVEGEVLSQIVAAESTTVDGIAHPTPPKRKGPPKHKKLKGHGRSKKKKNPVAPTSVPGNTTIDGAAKSLGGAVGPDGVKIENYGNEDGSVVPTPNEDTEMGEGSMAASDDEGGEDDEDGDEGDDDDGSVSAHDSPSRPLRPFSPIANELSHMRDPNLESTDSQMSGRDDLPGPPLPKLEPIEEKSGSALTNVTMTTYNVGSPSKSELPSSDINSIQYPIQESSGMLDTIDSVTLDAVMQQEVVETAPTTLPSPPPEPTMAEAISSAEVLQEEEEEEEMLLDIIENTKKNTNAGAPQEEFVTTLKVPAEPILQAEELDVEVPESTQVAETPTEEIGGAGIIEGSAEEMLKQPAEDQDVITNLLGGLERQLNEPLHTTSSVSEPEPVQSQAEPATEMTEAASEEKREEVNGEEQNV